MSAGLRAGYKQTEVGVIPVDWEVRSIGAVATMVASGRSSAGNAVGDYPVHGSTGVIGYTSHPEYEGDAILAARVGANAGRLNFVSGKYGVTDNTIMLRLSSNCCLPYFWRQLENKRLNTLVFGSGQPLITGTQLKALPIATPDLTEQRAIAAALSDVDALLGGLDRLIAKKQGLKVAAMQQLLTGQTRLPGFSGEWVVKRLGELFDVFAGGDFDPKQSSSERDERHPFPVYSNAVTDFGLYGFCSYSAYTASTITVTARGTLGVANFRDHPYTAIGRVLVLQPKQALDGRFFSDFIRNRITFVVESTGVPQLTAPQIAKYEVPTPPAGEQTAIAAVLSDMDTELAALQARRSKTQALKQAMMQELLTGRIRLV